MIKALMLAVATAGLGMALLSPASAQMRFDPGLNVQGSQPVVLAQYYRGRGYYRGGGYGGGVAAGIAGLAAGAIIGGALAAQQPAYAYPYPVYPGDPVAYCMSRFKSYDPGSGTYLGYDGYRHPCP